LYRRPAQESAHYAAYPPPVGRDEGVIRAYIRNQEEEDKRLDQLKLGY
jgi:hypothetical protein